MMKGSETKPRRVSVRELRQNLSRYEGRIVPARLDLAELGPPPERPLAMTISEALAAQREEG